MKEEINKLRYLRGYRRGLRGKPPVESWNSYIEGYKDGEADSKPGLRWRKSEKRY